MTKTFWPGIPLFFALILPCAAQVKDGHQFKVYARRGYYAAPAPSDGSAQ